jgi:hypothetical protein
MRETVFARGADFEMDELLTLHTVAEVTGARMTLIARLVRLGLLDTVGGEAGEPLMPRWAVVRLRQMQRLRRDLGVNFAGASVILDLVGRIEELNREMAELRSGADERDFF